MRTVKSVWGRIHWPAIAAALVTTSGLLLDPAMLNVVPEKYSRLLIGVGSVAQLLVKHVLKPHEARATDA